MKFTKFVKSLASEGVIYESSYAYRRWQNQRLRKSLLVRG